jgi:hypothetical protein
MRRIERALRDGTSYLHRAAPPAQREPAPAGHTELAICDQTIEIVCSQMTKTDLLAGWSGRNHVVNLHLGVGDDHAVK